MNENSELKNDVNEEEVSDEKTSLIATLGWILFGIFVVLTLIYGGMKILRDRNPSEVAKRFVRNNETIKQKTGGIVRIQGFNNWIERVKNWETSGKIFGNENNIEVSIQGWCGKGPDDLGACSVVTAKYRNANDTITDWNDRDWHEIEIGWLEKNLLVFK